MTIDPTVTSATLLTALVLIMQSARWLSERSSKKELKAETALIAETLKKEVQEKAAGLEKEVKESALLTKETTNRIEAALTDHKSRTEESLGKVLSEVQKTNGRVTSLERAHEIDMALRAAMKEQPAPAKPAAKRRKK